MSRVLCDVDGVIGDLMGRDGGGFTRWCRERGVVFDPEALGNLRVTGDHRSLLLEFLREDDVYLRYVNPIPGAQESLARLVETGHTLRFVTSITEEPNQYPAKNEWLQHHFGHIEFETLTIPSREKHYHIGDYMVDDRADTIARFLTVGERRGVFLFRQPWNFAYGDEGYWRDPDQFADVARILNQSYESWEETMLSRIRNAIVGPPSTPFVTHTDDWLRIELEIKVDSGARR